MHHINLLYYYFYYYCYYDYYYYPWQNLSQDEKMKTDRGSWEIWLAAYRDRLLKELDGLNGEEACREFSQRRVDVMNANNPRFILRNYIAQNAIEAAEKGDFTEVSSRETHCVNLKYFGVEVREFDYRWNQRSPTNQLSYLTLCWLIN